MKAICNIKKLPFVLLIVWVGISCNKDENATDVSLINSWKLISMVSTHDNQLVELPQNLDSMTITFVNSSIIKGTSICNSGSGTYLFKNDSMNITIGFTLMECLTNNSFPGWDEKFISNLNQAQKFSISGSELTLYSAGNYHLNFTLLKE